MGSVLNYSAIVIDNLITAKDDKERMKTEKMFWGVSDGG